MELPDHLRIADYFSSSEGDLLYSQTLKKINPHNRCDIRAVVITSNYLINLGPYSPSLVFKNILQTSRRCIPLSSITATSISSACPEVVVHVYQDYSYHFDMESPARRDEFLSALRLAFQQSVGSDLRVLSSSKASLRDFVMTKKNLKHYERVSINEISDNSDLSVIKNTLSLEKSLTGEEEQLLTSFIVMKVNKRNKQQERLLFITNRAVYTSARHKKNDYRKLLLSEIRMILYSLSTQDIVVFYPCEYDLYVKTENKEEVIKMIFEAQYELAKANPVQGEKELIVNATSVWDLSKFVMTKDSTNKFGYDFETHYWAVKEWVEEEVKEQEPSAPGQAAEDDGLVGIEGMVKKYSYERLKNLSSVPGGVDPNYREMHLTEEEFRRVFGMDIIQFAVLPKEKKEKMKRAVGLLLNK